MVVASVSGLCSCCCVIDCVLFVGGMVWFGIVVLLAICCVWCWCVDFGFDCALLFMADWLLVW